MITLFEIVFVILIGGSIIFYLACALCTYQFFSSDASSQEKTAIAKHTPVSILVSIRGLDEGAWENWTSLCTQNYPTYEVLFGVTDNNDPAIPMLEKLAATFPNRVKLFVGLEPRGVNLKDSNLSYLLEQSQHELIIFADGDIRVTQDYIQTVTTPLITGKASVITCAYIGYKPQFLGAALASLGRCADFIPSLLIARIIDGSLQLAVGVTIATHKATLASFGGLQLNRIGSDYNLGKRAALAGYQVELSHYILDWDTGNESIKQLYDRELRWARTIRFNRGFVYYSMAFCYGTVYCIPLLLLSHFSGWAIALGLTTLLIRYLQVMVSIFSMKCPKLLRWLWVILLRDVLSFIIWVIGGFGQRVYWRGRELRIEGDGLIVSG
ncbi:glycosyl transferase [Scytonema hofmannii PCC 7110]|uniref:Glycosyl transferase n=1 Tax=Scytonema hofmannii PCC 7110 TaxID=128403 RepID=A0A139X9R2_9CYAN|nr:glycosyltransferase [Scytonema hofmannii]KYC41430.1 glycosyl transferase [Scytonema hofmannii PCC 7110]